MLEKYLLQNLQHLKIKKTMDKTMKSLANTEALPLAKLYQILEKEDGRTKFSTLYKIDEQIDNNWTCIKKGGIDCHSQPLSESRIDELYSKYRGKENFRIVIYHSSLSNFPEKILDDSLALIKTKIKLLEEGIKIAENQGFNLGYDEDFEPIQNSQDSIFRESIIKIQSKTTGLVIQDELNLGFEDITFKIDLFKFFLPGPERKIRDVSLSEILSKAKRVDQLIISKLNLLLALFKQELAELIHRKEISNKSSFGGIKSSIWHTSKSVEPSIYLLEFAQWRSFFMKWRLQKIEGNYSQERISSEFHPSGGWIDFIYPTLYLEHGSTKYAGIPYACFGEADQDDVDSLTIEDIDYYYKRFLNEIHDIGIMRDYNRDKINKDSELDQLLQDINDLGINNDEHENIESYTTTCFEEGFDSEFSLGNVLHDIYCDPTKKSTTVIDDLKTIDDYENHFKRNEKILECVEDRQKKSSIWKVLGMD